VNLTPRTDAVRHGPSAGSFFTMTEHAETLEHENIALSAEVEQWETRYRLASADRHGLTDELNRTLRRAEAAEAALREIANMEDVWPNWEFRWLHEASRDAARAYLQGGAK